MKKEVLSFILVGLVTGSLWAQDSGAKLTFKNAVKLGLENNLLLNQQKNQLIYTEVNKTSNLLQMTPSVQVNGSAGRFDGNSFNQQRGEVVNGQIDFLNGSLGTSLPIFNGFNQMNAYRQASSQNEAQLSFVNRTAQDVIRNVASQYLNCLLDQQLVIIDEQNLQTQKTQYEQIRTQVELGSRAEADVFNQEFQVRNAELLLVRSKNRLKNDKAILAQTLMIDPIVAFELEQVNWGIDDLSVDQATVEQLNDLALEHRSDLMQANFSEKSALYGFYSVRGRYYPSLSAFGQLSSRYNYIYGDTENRSFNQQFKSDNRQISYGLQLTVPIFNGFISRAQVTQQKILFENAKLNTKNVEIKVKTDVLLAYQNFIDAKANYTSAEAQLKAGELAYKVEKERFDLGISSIVQLTLANQSFIKAQSDYASALFLLMFQKLLVNYATGTLQETDIP
ncbi:MAG: TolC family protein [Cyclobacteriaceae bacterium]|nr:TolC family protein [Cyclobacteriaceae bacterium]